MRNRFLILCLAVTVVAGCQRKYPEEKIPDPEKKERLLDASHEMIRKESEAIQDFISRHGWKMEMTGTGLRYQVYEKGNGFQADGQSVLVISYKVYLLDGTLCYEAGEEHPEHLVLEKGDQISGLEEGLLMMKEGSRARFVIPDHLAYGLTGDQDKIPPASALYYDVHLIRIEKPQIKK